MPSMTTVLPPKKQEANCNETYFDPPVRQPKAVTVTIDGVCRQDVLDMFPKMNSYLSGRFANVDFELRDGKVTFHCYPFAVND